ncbi:DUF4352 domain-containing protein [Staphylococcus coagulans]|uniref:DUF4352 domain-containing protein n=1 Tax=Staphylococcus coagulans TaxID=74706 RepID=UPI003365035B
MKENFHDEQQKKQWEQFQKFQKQQNKKGKKKWLWGCGGCLVVFIVLAILFSACTAIFTGNDKDSSNSTKNGSKEYKVGDTAKNGDLEVTVNSVENLNQVGNSVLPTSAKDTFVVVDVTIKNNGNEALTIDSHMFKLKSDDKTAEADSGASISANQSEDGSITDSFFLEQVNPDSTTQGKIVFDVSESFANADNKKLIVSSTFFSNSSVTFNLKSDVKTSEKKSGKSSNDDYVAYATSNEVIVQQSENNVVPVDNKQPVNKPTQISDNTNVNNDNNTKELPQNGIGGHPSLYDNNVPKPSEDNVKVDESGDEYYDATNE